MSTAELNVAVPPDLSVSVERLEAETWTALCELLGMAAPPVRMHLLEFQHGEVVKEERPPKFDTCSDQGFWRISAGERSGTVFSLVISLTYEPSWGVHTSINVDRGHDPFRYVIAAAFAIALARIARSPMVSDDLQFWVETDRWNEQNGLAELPTNEFITRLKAPGTSGTLEQAIALFMQRTHALWKDGYWKKGP